MGNGHKFKKNAFKVNKFNELWTDVNAVIQEIAIGATATGVAISSRLIVRDLYLVI